MSWWALLILVTLTWALGVTGVVTRPADAGFSWFPIFPLVPLVFFGAAMVLDAMTPTWGTRVVGALHATFIVAFLVGILRDRRRGRAAAGQDR